MIYFYPPVTISIGPLFITTHGLFIGFGILAGYLFAHRHLKNFSRLSRDTFESIAFWATFSGFIGSRMLYVGLNWYVYRENWWDILRVWEGGLISFGGMIGGIIGAIIVIALRKESIRQWGDFGIPYLFLGWSIGRIGDFLGWEEIGTPTTLPWGLIVDGDVPRHPQQLYSTIVLFVLFMVLWKLRSRIHRSGNLFCLGLGVYGMIRFFTEFIRDYPNSEYVFSYRTFAQGMSVALIIASGILWRYWRRKNNSDVSINKKSA